MVRPSTPITNLKPSLVALVNSRNDPPFHLFAVRVPIFSILPPALLLVSSFSVDKKNSEVDQIEIRDWDSPALHALGTDQSHAGILNRGSKLVTCRESGEAVCPRHDPVAQIIDMTRHTPPAGGDESSAVGCLNVFEMLNRWVFRILPECGLLAVACAEDIVAGSLDCEDHEDVEQPKIDRVDREIFGG